MWKPAAIALDSLADQLGYRIIPKWRLRNLEFASHLSRIFGHYGVSCVFDVGANVGDYGRFLRQEVGFHGLIVSIEPIDDCRTQLRRKAAGDPKWVVLHGALGAIQQAHELD